MLKGKKLHRMIFWYFLTWSRKQTWLRCFNFISIFHHVDNIFWWEIHICSQTLTQKSFSVRKMACKLRWGYFYFGFQHFVWHVATSATVNFLLTISEIHLALFGPTPLMSWHEGGGQRPHEIGLVLQWPAQKGCEGWRRTSLNMCRTGSWTAELIQSLQMNTLNSVLKNRTPSKWNFCPVRNISHIFSTPHTRLFFFGWDSLKLSLLEFPVCSTEPCCKSISVRMCMFYPS